MIARIKNFRSDPSLSAYTAPGLFQHMPVSALVRLSGWALLHIFKARNCYRVAFTDVTSPNLNEYHNLDADALRQAAEIFNQLATMLDAEHPKLAKFSIADFEALTSACTGWEEDLL